jgi:RNA polymerase sigma-70 factor (ECF subfamily)
MIETDKTGSIVDPTSDNTLMEQVKDGQVAKLAILFERHHVMLFNFFLRLTGRRGPSEDLVQDVFVRILKYRATYRSESKFSVWMYQIARNAHMDYLRKQKPEVPLGDQFEEPAGAEPPPADRMDAEIDAALLRRALDRLPLRKKEILLLSRYENMKYKDIADLLGCSIETIKTSVHRAIRDLRTIYFELQGGVS